MSATVAEFQLPTRETAPEKCPNCAGQLHFSAADGQMKCLSCGFLVAVRVDPQSRVVEHDLVAALARQRPRGPIGAGSRQLKCSECGAVVEFPDNVTARKCEFCDSPAVLKEEARADHYLPETVVPFAIPREAATASFRTWLGKLWFRPSNLKHKADISELHGVYVPFWTFDADVDSDWTADAGYYYYETEHYTVTVNGKSERRSRQVRKIRWQPASGRRHDRHDDHLVCASRGLPDALASRMANFDTRALVPYTRELLQGFSAESYAVDLPDAWGRAKAEIAQIQEARCAGDVPGDTHRFLRVSNDFEHESFKHVLLPVWVAAYRYGDKVFRFLVNGQTGRVSGDAPYSWVKITLFVLMCLVVAGLVFALVQRNRG
jgi:DNA-directed RNA polymerase subunit RPC12/RpoP